MPSPTSRRAESRRTKNLTDEDRHQVVTSFLIRATEGNLKRGDVAAVAAKHSIHPRTAARVWERAKCEAERSGNYIAVSRIHQAGRPRTDRTATLELLRRVDFAARSTVRSAAAACGMDPSTLHRELKRRSLRTHTSVAKPMLNDGNKAARLQFCLSHIDTQTMLFDDMMSIVHVDEKIFYVTEPTKRFILLPDEPEPVRKLRSKRFITRVMFLAAVGRPRFDENMQQLFDGKVGIWAFVERVAAQRSSSRRPAGTPVTKEVSVTKESYRAMLTTKLLPALQDRWPSSSPVIIQQDNAPAHISQTDPDFLKFVEQSGCNVTLRSQPPNSPDLNVLDLGLFNAIQSRQRLKSARTIDELIEAVTTAFWEVPASTVNATFLSLQCSMDECIHQRGDNNYKPRHMNKSQLEREGRLPISIRCSDFAQQILSAPSGL